MCKVDSDVDKIYRLGNGSAVACTISLEIWFQVLLSSSFRFWYSNLHIAAIEFEETIF